MEKVIEIAKKNGYECKYFNSDGSIAIAAGAFYGDIFLDPLFWLALGKSLTYENVKDSYGEEFMPWWKMQMHCFIDHLAEGKNAESFFEELLK